MRAFALPMLSTALLLSACASTPPPDPASLRLADDGPVMVSWDNPATFREFSCRMQPSDGDWVRRLAEHVRTQAQRQLPAGASLTVHFSDIDRAGECEPARYGQEYRVLRDVTPPRMQLNYQLTLPGQAAQGATDVRLIDMGYLQRPMLPNISTDALVHEKRLLDDWLRRTLAAVQ